MTRFCEFDPERVREALARFRREGLTFEQAWLRVPAATPLHPSTIYGFARKHFEAAYNRDDSKLGRLGTPAPETSTALPPLTFSGREVDRDSEIIAAVRGGATQADVAVTYGITASRVSQIVSRSIVTTATSTSDRCRSGDGCDRLATRGRFGPTFCEYHGTELARMAAAFKLEVGSLDPRKSGNRSIRQAA